MRDFDASAKAELQPVARVLKEIKRQADQANIKIMVVGATARDILIRQVVGSAPERATEDLDVAVGVASWDEVNKLTRSMQSAGPLHKFHLRGMEVDLIPFGAIESAERTITWSDDHQMDVFGFREAWADRVMVRLPFEMEVAVASLPAQSLLKIFAWRDRRNDDRRDAIDLRSILLAYSQGPYWDELYEEFGRLVQANDFVPEHAGAERMGAEAARLIAPADRGVVLKVLRDVELTERLMADMGGIFLENAALVSAYVRGFE